MTTARDYWDNQPRYQQIAADLVRLIESGELKHGDQLPTEETLREKYGVSRGPVRDALTVLNRQGYVVSRRPAGTFVHRPSRLDLPMYVLEKNGGALDAFVAAVEQQGHKASQTIRVETIKADTALASVMSVEPGSLLTVRRRLRFVDSMPYAIADSYFPADVVAGSPIAEPDDIPTGGRHVLAELGYAMVHHVDQLTGRHPSRDEGLALELPPDLALFVHKRTSSTANGKPIRHMVQILPSDRWRICYEVES